MRNRRICLPIQVNSVEEPTFGSSVPGNTERRVSIAFCPGYHDRHAFRYLGQDLFRIDRPYHLKELYRRHLLSSGSPPWRYHRSRSPFPGRKPSAFSSLNAFLSRRNASLFPIENQAKDTPHIILNIRVIKIHAPTSS